MTVNKQIFCLEKDIKILDVFKTEGIISLIGDYYTEFFYINNHHNWIRETQLLAI